MSAAIYPTRLGSASIRLLELQPGAENDTIDCRLHEAPLSSLPAFEAISYVWGDPNQRESITCNGHEISITISLAQILRRLRQRETTVLDDEDDHDTPATSDAITGGDFEGTFDRKRLVWADAICINQADIQERNSQVPLMQKIYSTAQKVTIWLGPDTDGHAKKAFASIETLSSYVSTNGSYADYKSLVEDMSDDDHVPSWLKCRIGEFSPERFVAALRHHHGIDDPWASLQAMFSVPWWSRVWCVQEAHLARDVAMLFGTESTSGSSVAMFIEWYRMESHLDNSYRVEALPLKALENTGIHHALNTFHPTKKTKDLWMLCEGFRSLQATNPRDKVYGLLGMWYPRATSGSIRIDYNLSVARVYADVVLQSMSEPTGLFILRMVHHATDYDFKIGDEFPSWVPRWDVGESWGFATDCVTRASDYGLRPIDRDSALAGTLRLHGHSFDQVVWTSRVLGGGPSSYYTDDHFRTVVQMLWKEAIGLEASGDFSHRVSLLELATALTQGLITLNTHAQSRETDLPDVRLDITNLNTPAGERFLEHFKTFMDSDTYPGDPTVFARMFFVQNKCLFRTSRGYVGLGKRNTRPGDYVTVLDGGEVPFVLRLNLDLRCFNLVGECFVYDIMNCQIHDMVGKEEGVTPHGLFRIR